MPFISNIYSTSNTDNSSVKKFNESEIYIASSLNSILRPNYFQTASTGTYSGINNYKKGNHFYVMYSRSEGSYSTDAIVTFYDIDLTTHVSTLRTHKIGTMSEATYGQYTTMLSIIDGKALIECGSIYGFYDFENDVFTKIKESSRYDDSIFCNYQVGYIGWTRNIMTNLKTFVNTYLSMEPRALIVDSHTGRKAWITGITSDDYIEYMFFDDTSGKTSTITSFPDCRFAEKKSQSSSVYTMDNKCGLNRHTTCTRNLILGFITDDSVCCSIYDVYSFDSSKAELKIRRMLAPHEYKLYKTENNDMLLISPIYSCYHTSSPNTDSVSVAYSIGEQPLEWYGLLFEDKYKISDVMGKYTLDD